MLIIGIDFDG